MGARAVQSEEQQEQRESCETTRPEVPGTQKRGPVGAQEKAQKRRPERQDGRKRHYALHTRRKE